MSCYICKSSDHTDALFCPFLPFVQQIVQEAMFVTHLHVPNVVKSNFAMRDRILVTTTAVPPHMQPPPPRNLTTAEALTTTTAVPPHMQPPPPRNLTTAEALTTTTAVPPRMRNVITKEIAVEIFKQKYKKNRNSASVIAMHYKLTAKAVREIWTMRTWKSTTKFLWNTIDQAEYKTLGGARRI
jgi:hypothetical protein